MASNASPEAIADIENGILATLLRPYRRCAILDFPDHGNVGDSAIWSGEIEGLRALGIEIAYVGTRLSFCAKVMRERMPEGVVLIHGGGNFGTIWPECQEHREQAIAELKDYPIVQLPQSLFFDDAAAIERMRGLIAAHPDFTLMVRDEPSREISERQLGARTVLCPDSAFFLHRLLRRDPASVDILTLARTDHERVTEGLESLLAKSGHTFEMVDWLEEPMTFGRRLADKVWPRAFGRLTRVPGFFRLLRAAWDAASWARIERGCRLLSRGRVVLTDRLHAHILCMMLGIPHVVLDNHYGKIRNFMASWTDGNPLVHRASTPAEAVAQAVKLAAAAR